MFSFLKLQLQPSNHFATFREEKEDWLQGLFYAIKSLYTRYYCLSKNSWRRILYSKLLYKLGQDFFGTQYFLLT